ncbi:MAG: DUF5134 domain-containing protein [Mycobacteriales bacterium]
MTGAAWVRWVFAAMFAALALFSVVRLLVAGRVASREPSGWDGGAGRSVDVSRGVMSLGMVAMLLPGVDPLPRLYWQVLFGAAAGHIAVRLIRRSMRPAPVSCPDLCDRHELHLMIGGLAMVYMLAAMPAGHVMAAGTGMAGGMEMAGMGSTGLAIPALTWALIAYFLVFAVRLSARLTVPVNTIGTAPAGAGGPRGVVVSPHLLGSSEVVMGIGMSYMLMTML